MAVSKRFFRVASRFASSIHSMDSRFGGAGKSFEARAGLSIAVESSGSIRRHPYGPFRGSLRAPGLEARIVEPHGLPQVGEEDPIGREIREARDPAEVSHPLGPRPLEDPFGVGQKQAFQNRKLPWRLKAAMLATNPLYSKGG
jgi:hypothetical protein